MSIGLERIPFIEVCPIVPDRDDTGTFLEFFPQEDYADREGKELHEYGRGPFCRFRIPAGYEGKTGVYAILSDEELCYVGECEDLAKRYNTGYGQISPRNCYGGGRPTNCRINTAILHETKAGRYVRLFWHETGDRFNLESHLIERFDPAWNRSAGKRLAARAEPAVASAPAPESLAPGKYEALRRYLEASPHELEFLSYRALEEILGDGLPPSAYNHRAWWANGGHAHAEAWMKAGWRVGGVKLGKYTVWRKWEPKRNEGFA